MSGLSSSRTTSCIITGKLPVKLMKAKLTVQSERHCHQAIDLQRYLFNQSPVVCPKRHEHQVSLESICHGHLLICRYLLPNSVIQYIYDHKLYKESDVKAVTV
jgi:nicotinic acid mononucleotide adenylyltransferase